MPKRLVIHVLPNKIGGIKDWKITKEKTTQPIAVFENKQKAIEKARTILKKQEPSQMKIHGRDGKIQTEYTYEADPKRYKG